MGTTREPKDKEQPGGGLAGALFSPVQQRVLALLYGQPDRAFQSAELIRLVRGGTGAVHRQLTRLTGAGLLSVEHLGNQKFYRANRECPVFEELHGLVVKTVGLVGPLREALEPLAPRIRVAFVYGSVARGADRAASDVDLLVIAEGIDSAEIYDALQRAEAQLARTVHPMVLQPAEWLERKRRDSFAARVAEREKLFVIGGPGEVP